MRSESRWPGFSSGEGDLRFEFFLADRLRMPVWEMRERVPNAEYVQWVAYHSLLAQEQELAMKTKGR